MLTKFDLDKIEKRIDEISRLCDLCDAQRDRDILLALDIEVDEIIKTLENNRTAKPRLYLVK